MSRFIQLHALTFYPPSNLNRDDTGRPKTAVMGGVERLRISSQALKRAIRTSDVFERALAGRLGKRTQRFGEEIEKHLAEKGAPPEKANAIAREIAQIFGKIDAAPDKEKKGKEAKGEEKPPSARTAQLAFVGPEEWRAALELAERKLADDKTEIAVEHVLRRADTAADIAMFGRMLADNPDFNREAAVQVAHAVTTHRIAVEDDYYTAVDDLKKPSEDAGAGFVGELGFGSGVFYVYVCVDTKLLTENLGGDEALAKAALAAFVEALATVSPTGKQASFASRARASYLLAEIGDQQPRTLASAFIRPVSGSDIEAESIDALEKTRARMDKAYGDCAKDNKKMNVPKGEGSLGEIQSFVTDW
jgi:CRISPR system Cascade subunit CasC